MSRLLPFSLPRLPHGVRARLRAILLPVVAASVTLSAIACQDTTAPTATGSLTIEFDGLPAGATGEVHLSRGTASRLASRTATLEGLDAGNWTLSAGSVTFDGVVYEPQPTSTTVNVPARSIGSARVVWTPVSGALQLGVLGLSAGTSADILVTGPAGFSRIVTASTVLRPLPPGQYTIAARDVRSAEGTQRAALAVQTILVGASAVAASASVTYGLAPSVVDVIVSGLPGTAAAISLTSPTGSTVPIGGTTRIAPAVSGRWQLTASSVQAAGFTYVPTPASRDTVVSAGDTLRLPVTYTLTTGALAVAVTGLPQGATGTVQVTGPGGFSRALTSTTTIADLAPGTYTVSADSVVRTGLAYRPVIASQQVLVAASLVAAPATVAYAPVSGTLVVSVSNVPAGGTGSVRITGPYGFDRTISGTTVFTPTAAGPYTIVASSFVAGGLTYSVSPATVNRTVAIGGRDSVDMRYAAASGSLAVTISGLPNGTNAALTLVGNGQSINITGTTTLTGLAVGNYTLTAANVSTGGTSYAPTPTSQNISITSGVQGSASVTYAAIPTSGSLQVTVNGLPGGVNAALTLSGVGPATNITGSTTLSGLAVGSYTLTAANVSSGGTNYTAAPASQNVTITNGVQSVASVTYSATASLVDLTIEQAHLTQATQKYDGTVALVAGRNALLRVFARADRSNLLTPTVRARIYDGATLLQTLTLTGPAGGVPMAVTEGTLASSWNTVITGANVRAAMRILVDIDPTNAVAEDNETNNSWPGNGTPQSITVNSVPDFNVRFVPVTVGSLTGNVSVGNMNSFLTTTRLIWPIATINADVRAPFTSSADTLTSNDTNSQWLTVLSEMNTLRSADGAPSTQHYYGVLKVGYSSGIAGYGYVPGRAAIGWDYLPSGDGVAAHEWGHNFGRGHAPCGGVSGADPSFPYAGGAIGVFGWNSTTNALVSPTTSDIMGYCNPKWISDYNWTGVMTYRQSSGSIAEASADGEGLLVWGRVVNGIVQLEPAFRVKAPRTAAQAGASHVVEALDADGNVLLTLPITPERVDHVTTHDERQFAVIVPWTAALEEALSRVRVRDLRSPLLAATRASAAAVSAGLSRTVRPMRPLAMPDPASQVESAPAGRARVRWNKAAYPMAMVRDAATGQIMGYVRNSGDAVVTGGRRLEVVYSDGARSVVKPQ